MKTSMLAALSGIAVFLAGCVAAEPTLTLTDMPQPLPQAAVLSGSENTSTELALVTEGTAAAVPPPGVPIQSPKNQAQPTQSQSLGIADSAARVNAAENAINAATVENNQQSSEDLAQAAQQAGSDASNSTSVDQQGEQQIASQNPASENTEEATIETAPEPKRTSLFARLFQTNPAPKNRTRPTNIQRNRFGRQDEDDTRIALAHNRGKPSDTVRSQRTTRQVFSSRPRSPLSGDRALPGVKSNSELFGLDDGTGNAAETRLASAAGLGRLSPNGLRVQHEKVQVACLKPGVIKLLKIVERHYGKKPIITSGYRSPKRNRRAGGARNSQHIYCKAVDIQVEGVSKWDLAKYLRTIPGRGGVGTYCRTKSVHLDIGSKRDWHHPCRRSSKRKKRA